MDWFLYDRDLCHERIKQKLSLDDIISNKYLQRHARSVLCVCARLDYVPVGHTQLEQFASLFPPQPVLIHFEDPCCSFQKF